MKHLLAAVNDILADGYKIGGIDPARVVISVDQPSAMCPLPPAAPPGYHGDISACCGAPAERRGTCLYCTACGSSNGCS